MNATLREGKPHVKSSRRAVITQLSQPSAFTLGSLSCLKLYKHNWIFFFLPCGLCKYMLAQAKPFWHLLSPSQLCQQGPQLEKAAEFWTTILTKDVVIRQGQLNPLGHNIHRNNRQHLRWWGILQGTAVLHLRFTFKKKSFLDNSYAYENLESLCLGDWAREMGSMDSS